MGHSCLNSCRGQADFYLL